MSYRSRDSNIFRAGAAPPRGSTIGSSQPPPPTTTKKSKPVESEDDSILLKDDEIVSCLSVLISMHFSLSDLMSPSPTQVQLVYEQLVAQVMGVRRETVDALLNVGMSEMEHPETHKESMSLMAFYRSLSRLMVVCDVRDFSFQDLLKPDYKRLRVHLSRVINFMRFRGDEERSGFINEQVARLEEAKTRLEELFHENEHLQSEIVRVGEQVKQDGPAIKVAKEVNEALTSDLRAMKKQQEKVSNEHQYEKTDRLSLKSALTDRQYLVVKGKQECDKIRPYIVDSPERLQQIIVDMNATLWSEKNLSDTLERRIRALQTSMESFTILEADVTSCIKIMEECEGELVKVEEMARKVSKHEEILKSRENENKGVERQEALLTRQLVHLRERIDRVRAQAEGKREQAQRRMEELKGVYDELSRERGEKSKEMERKKMRIEQIEKKMADLKEKTEDEVHRAHVEMAKMKAHIEAYIREMEQRINSIS